jgi:hypothetical protein
MRFKLLASNDKYDEEQALIGNSRALSSGRVQTITNERKASKVSRQRSMGAA